VDLLQIGSSGKAVRQLQRKLTTLGFQSGVADGDFGPATQAAVLAFQKSEGLLADGVAGPRTLQALGLARDDALHSVLDQITPRTVSEMFPATQVDAIKANLPAILEALREAQLCDRPMVLMALATIRAETESFVPVNEGISKFNTSPGGRPFDLYDNRKDLGNQGPSDGADFRGRGFVQLTGRANYRRCGEMIGMADKLVQKPDLANDRRVAANLLAAFVKDKERAIKEALLEQDLRAARRLVNGGSHGLDRFTDCYLRGERLIT
jgi:peptidoglycan L-alanyl-D-glutamate endopeptidase CwlK